MPATTVRGRRRGSPALPPGPALRSLLQRSSGRGREPPGRLASVNSTVFASATTHLATTGPVGSSSTLEGALASQRPDPATPTGDTSRTTPSRASAPAGQRPDPATPTDPGAGGDRHRSATSLWRDPFRRQRARYGSGAGFRWWHRLGAAAALLVLIGVLGVLLAALVGFLAFVGGVALEAVIG